MRYYLLLITTILLFSGCSSLKEINLYKSRYINDSYTFKDLPVETQNNDSNLIEKMNSVDNQFFQDKKINVDVTIDQETIQQFTKKNVVYDQVPFVYKKLVDHQEYTMNDFVLKGSDYLTLYKMLYINQKDLFDKEKNNIIQGFLFQIQDYLDLDFKQIKIAMKDNQFNKLNKLKKEIIILEKEQ